MAPSDPSWNFQDPASKQRVLDVLQAEMDSMFDLVADPGAMGGARPRARTGKCATSSATWSTRPRATCRRSQVPAARPPPEAPLGLRDMATHVDEGAKSLRKVPREELIGRLARRRER